MKKRGNTKITMRYGASNWDVEVREPGKTVKFAFSPMDARDYGESTNQQKRKSAENRKRRQLIRKLIIEALKKEGYFNPIKTENQSLTQVT